MPCPEPHTSARQPPQFLFGAQSVEVIKVAAAVPAEVEVTKVTAAVPAEAMVMGMTVQKEMVC